LRILITGFSTRGIAEAAVRSGYSAVTIDFFGDYDQRLLVKNYSLMRDFGLSFSTKNILQVSSKIKTEADALVYISPFENHPGDVQRMSRGRMLLGNAPESLRKVRNWRLIRSFLKEEGIGFPETIFTGETLPQSGTWVVKPVKSGGGHRIKLWQGERLKKGYFLQKLVNGIPCSAVFVANEEKSVLLGITEQLIGRPELGSRGFTWCGNITPVELDKEALETLVTRIDEIAFKLTKFFGLRGINGFDFILSEPDNAPVLVEINPRYPASVEIIEAAFGLPVFDIHVRGCLGKLPDFSLGERLNNPRYYGKAIVYAKEDVRIPPEAAYWVLLKRKDVPFPGETIRKGHPICTVFATGETREECWNALLTEAGKLEAELKPCLILTSKEKEE
jgi:predicted ATP-grasp superfamily ATP-dependent carboligase